MKVCFLITGLAVGGAEKHLLKILPTLKFEKFIISLTNINDIGKQIEQKGIKVYYLGLNRFNLPLVIYRFARLIKLHKPDIIDTYLIHSNLLGRFLGRLFGVKKIICSVRNDYSDFKLLSFLDRISQNLVNLYILNSNALINYVHNRNRIPLKKMKIIPNGVDLNKIYSELDKNYDIREKLGLNKNSFIIISTARLQIQKSISTLVKAIKLVNDNIFLIIAGEGPERNNLEKLIKKLNLQNRIFFLGLRHDIPNLLNSSDVFVLPSLKEGMSNALLEAMALKKICIVSNIPQNKELIQDGINGWIFEKKNEKALAKIIENVYNTKNLASMQQSAFNYIKQNYQIKNIIEKYERVIEKLYN